MRMMIPLLFATVAFAADSAPLVEASLPDGARLRAHVETSIYGTLWVDPACAPLRARLDAQIATLKEEDGFDLPRWYGALVNAGLVAYAPPVGSTKPRAAMMIDVGTQAADLFAAWRASADEGTTPAESPRADEAFLEKLADGERQLVARIGSLVASTSDGSPVPAWRPAPGSADLSLHLDVPAVMAVLDQAGKALGMPLGRIRSELTVVPEGVLDRITSDAAAPWLVAVERSSLDRLPANALTAVAVGIDGKHLWAALRQPLLGRIAEADGLAIDDVEAGLDANLAEMGVSTGLGGLVEGLVGTITLAVTPSAPFPAATLTIPRGVGIDQLVTALATQLGGEIPAAGASSILPIPGAPVLVTLACDAKAWLITSDPAAATTWVGGSASGWATTPAATLALAKGGDGAVLIGASDTPTLVRTLTPFVALVLGQAAIEAPMKQATLQSLARVAALAKTGYLVGRSSAGGIEIESRGLIPASMVPLMSLGVLVGSQRDAQHLDRSEQPLP